MKLKISSLQSYEEPQAKLTRKVSGEAVISFKRSWWLALCRAMKSYKRSLQEKFQVKLVLALGEANILPLQQGYKASSEAILLGLSSLFTGDTWLTVCFTGSVRFKPSLCLWGLAEPGRQLVRISSFINVDKFGYHSDQLKCYPRNLSFGVSIPSRHYHLYYTHFFNMFLNCQHFDPQNIAGLITIL